VRRAPTAAAALVALLVLAAPAAAAAGPPHLTARSAFLVQPDTRDVVYARNADQPRAMASTTKLMTALLALERLDLSDVLTVVPYTPGPAESLAGLKPGERISAADLLRALLLPSGNDAAETLAVDIAGSQSRFVALMNQRARELGLRSTHYANPVGLDQPGNRSSARDLVELALVLRRNAFFRRTTNEPRATLHLRDGRRLVLVNRNTLVGRVPYVDGVKTGHTLDAGYVLVGSATRDGVNVVSVVMGEPSEAARDADTLALLRYGLARYRRVLPVAGRARLAVAKVADQGSARVALVAARPVSLVVRRGERPRVRLVGVPSDVSGPLAAGTPEGGAEVVAGGRVLARVPLVTARAVRAASVGQRLRSWLGRTATVVLLIALLACTVQLVLLRRRVVRRRRRSATGEAEAT
jgi:D-alanyl-D-alanine carboxypeptidase (penicillin-binding protein 5/6)